LTRRAYRVARVPVRAHCLDGDSEMAPAPWRSVGSGVGSGFGSGIGLGIFSGVGLALLL